MRKLLLACVFVFLFTRQAYAVELSIYDPVVQNLEVSVNASMSSTSNYYLQGVLRSQTSSKYFGETQNLKGDWLDYISSPEKEFITSNFYFTEVQNASWSGMIKLRFKADDPNYLGPGMYDIKLRRFTGGSTSSAGDSNTISINLTAPLPIPSIIPSPSPSPIPSPSPSPSPSLLPSPSPTLAPKPTSPSPIPIATVKVSSVAGAIDISLDGFGISPSPPASTPSLSGDSRKALSLNQARLKTVIMLGIGLALLFTSLYLGYRKYQKQSSKTV